MKTVLLTLMLLVHTLGFSQDAGGVLAGQIRGLNGKPARGIRVAVSQIWSGPEGLAPAPTPQQIVATDSAGRYRLTSVPPGRYFILAGRIDTLSYYPGTRVLTEARIVTLESGSTTDDLNFQLVQPAGAKVSGQLTLEGDLEAPRQMILRRWEPSFLREEVDIEPDGSFSFLGIPPGSYRLDTHPDTVLSPTKAILVKDKNITGVRVRASAVPLRTRVPGQVQVAEDNVPLPLFGFEVRSKSGKTGAGMTLTDEGEGAAYSLLPPGDLRMSVSGLPKEFRVESFTHGNTDLLKNSIRVPSDDQQLELKLSVAQPSRLRRIRGHVRGIENLPFPSNVTLWGPSLLGPVQASVRSDGSYEFSNLMSGTYTLTAGDRQRPTVVVGDNDIENLDITLPTLHKVLGRVVVQEGGGPIPRYDIQLSRENSAIDYYPLSSVPGIFATLMPEGDYFVKFFGFPPEVYEVQSITYGTTDVRKSPFRVIGTKIEEIVVTLRFTKPTVKVTGQVFDPSGRSALSGAAVLLFTSGYALSMRATAGPDGSFEFPTVPQGTYTISSGSESSYRTVNVGPEDVDGIELTLSGQRFPATRSSRSQVVYARSEDNAYAERVPSGRYRIHGRVVVDGGGPLPRARVRAGRNNFAQVQPIGGTVIGETHIRSDGTFSVDLPEGEHLIDVSGIAAPYRVKSIQYGSADLLRQKLKVTGTDAQEILVTLELARSVPWITVSGRVRAEVQSLPGRVILVGDDTRYFINATIEPSGAFVLPRVPPGTYTVLTKPPVFGMPDRQIVVEPGIGMLDLAVPEQRPVTFKVQVDGGGNRPGFSFNITNPIGEGFQFLFLGSLTSPIMTGRTDMECISDVCSTARLGRLVNEPVVVGDAATPETFRLMLPEGEYSLEIRGNPQGPILKSVAFGSTDLLKESMRVTAAASQEVIVTFANP